MSQSSSRVILVTGASSGIGAAVASRLAADGHEVFGTSRRGGRSADGVELLPLDVRSDESVRDAVATLLRRTGRIDVLVNNAGYLVSGAIEETTMAAAHAQLETNFFGVARLVAAVLPHMRESGNGHILATSSLAGLVPVPFWGFYSASKFALEGYMESLRHEVRPFGIKVAMVEPGAIKTPFYAQPASARMEEYQPWRARLERTMRAFEEKAPGPEVVAEVFSKLVRSENPPLRNRVTPEATMFTLLKWLLPASIFEAGTRAGFNLDKAGFEGEAPVGYLP
jgi:NAD(P)-dependent dehydrogenase (short-subunit alcohol dehydrogenase family)